MAGDGKCYVASVDLKSGTQIKYERKVNRGHEE
jgi:hypothetical protein